MNRAITGYEIAEDWGLKVFISYSHSDRNMFSIIVNHLSTLQYEGWVKVWHDGKIAVGSQWNTEIEHALLDSDIIILVFSNNFFSSRYCEDKELPLALKNYKQGKSALIPILLEDIENSNPLFNEVRKIQSMPSGKPYLSWVNKEKASENIGYHLRKTVIKLFRETYKNSKSNDEYSDDSFMFNPGRLIEYNVAVAAPNKILHTLLQFGGMLLGILAGRLAWSYEHGHLHDFESITVPIAILAASYAVIFKLIPLFANSTHLVTNFSELGLFLCMLALLLVGVLLTAVYSLFLSIPLFIIFWITKWEFQVLEILWLLVGAILGFIAGHFAFFETGQKKYIPGDLEDKYTKEPRDTVELYSRIEEQKSKMILTTNAGYSIPYGWKKFPISSLLGMAGGYVGWQIAKQLLPYMQSNFHFRYAIETTALVFTFLILFFILLFSNTQLAIYRVPLLKVPSDQVVDRKLLYVVFLNNGLWVLKNSFLSATGFALLAVLIFNVKKNLSSEHLLYMSLFWGSYFAPWKIASMFYGGVMSQIFSRTKGKKL